MEVFMKKCLGCGLEKSLDEFAKNKSKSDGRQSQCRACKKKTDALHYQANKDQQLKRNRENYRKYKQQFDDLKSAAGCIKCGDKDGCCLDFHHPDPNKEGNVSTLIQRKGVEAALREAKKCVVICASCHRKLHAGRFEI
jgi:hypothetical protein